MSDRDSDYLWAAFAFVLMLIVAFLSFDGVGRLVVFLHREQQYLAIGFVVFLYVIAVAIARWSFGDELRYFGHNLEKQIAELSSAHKGFQLQEKNYRYEYEQVRKELEFLRKRIEEQWNQCEKTIKKVDEFAQQKTPVIIQGTSLDTLEAAMADVTGGEA